MALRSTFRSRVRASWRPSTLFLPPSYPASSFPPSSSSQRHPPTPPASLHNPSPPPPSPRPSIYHRVGLAVAEAATAGMRDDGWSCLVILVTFWIFGSMTLILGFCGSVNLVLGPNCSRLVQANSFFVHNINMKADAGSKHGPMVYGFHEIPPLDVRNMWSETCNVSIPDDFHKEGSRIEISYSIGSQLSYPLILVVAQGKGDLIQWIENPSHPNITFFWTLIHGNGTIEKAIEKASDYYIAVGNLNQIDMEVQLDFSFLAVLYNTTGAYYTCSLDQKLYFLKQYLSRANAAILRSPNWKQVPGDDEWDVEVSYEPRWLTFIVGSGMIILVILLSYKILTNLTSISGDNSVARTREAATGISPLLSNKDEDSASLGSSYESVSHDEEDPEESPGEGEISCSKYLCTLCCDAQRDCFFLPCGHCAVCYTCGRRVLDEAGTCPICQRKTKKVRKIFAV